MSKKWTAISVLLFIVACLLGWWLHNSIRQYSAENDLEKLQPAQGLKAKITQDKSLLQLPSPKNYIPSDFAVIPENDLFSESRSGEEEETENAAQMEAQPLAQKPVLVGVNIIGDQKTALLVDPKPSSQNRKRQAEIKRIGDVFQGYTIADIAPDYIVLESGSRKEIIPLHEGSKQTSAGRTPILSTRVVSFGGGAASGGAPIVNTGRGAVMARTAAAPASSPGHTSPPAAAAAAAVTVTPVSEPSRESPATASPPQASSPQASSPQRVQSLQQSPNAGSSSPKTRVVRTPFGDIVRPVRD